jgi:hypothetical protein
MIFPVIAGYPLCSFTNNFEIPNNSVLSPPVGEKGIFPLSGVFENPVNPLQYLGQINSGVFLHNGRASLRILRRKSQ